MKHMKNRSPELRAKELLSKMTLEEKLQQMNIYESINKACDELMENGGLESRGGTFACPENDDKVNKLQDYALHDTRLGIPYLVAFESLHGLLHPRATVFPQCAGLGGSFDREIVRQMAEAIGKEAKATGIRQVYAPCVDIPRDPRWGRMQESYGEDPYLVGEMGAEYVRGIQSHKVAATAKHYLAYGVPEGGINLAPAHIGEREIREVMLEPFQKLIEAGVLSVMPSYNEIDGEPVHASEKYMKDLLREELGFDGVVISDYGAIEMLHHFHRIAPDALEAGKLALKAGIDIEAPVAYGYGDLLKEAIEDKIIDEQLVDDAVLRILTLKCKLGLFEDPYADSEKSGIMHSREAVELALQADEESILLLKNDGILPLDEKKIRKAAVIGNNAKNSFLGDYISPTENCVSFYDGIVKRLGEERVLYSHGCNPVTYTEEMIQEAVETAKQADLVFLVLGDSATRGGGIAGEGAQKGEITCGEGYDMHTLDFPPSQRRLFDEITKLNKPTILILYAGRPYTLENDMPKVNGFMYSWGGGEQSGNAFANLIFGDKSPSAKLSVSFPKTVGHLPCYYNYKPSARGSNYQSPGTVDNPGRDYVLSSPNAWLPFGYGLTYSKINYSDLRAEVLDNGNVCVRVDVKNDGAYSVKESVLLFLKAMYAPVTPFVKRLRAFEKVELKPGEKKTVHFMLSEEDFTYVDRNYKTVKLPGSYKILVEDLQCEIEY